MKRRVRELPQVAAEVVLSSGFAGGTDLPARATTLPADGRLLVLLTIEAAAFALAISSGKMPEVVMRLLRALLTL